MRTRSRYVPALSYRVLTPLYDPLLRYGMRESKFKRRLIEEAHIAPGSRVLDLGCGTGTLTILIKQMQPAADVVGLDGDPEVLAIARVKAERQGVQIPFDKGLAFELPYPDNAFDIVLSSLMLHHLTTEDREATLAQVLRTLNPGGKFLIVDYGKPQNALAQAISLVMRHLERTRDLIDGLLPEQLRQAGFEDVEIVTTFMTLFGTVALYRARKA